MQILTIEIGGKSFKVACNPGDEERLFSAARVIDKMFQELKEYSPHASNELLFVMCALQLQDKIVGLEEEVANGGKIESDLAVKGNTSEQVTQTLSEVTTILEGLASQIKKC